MYEVYYKLVSASTYTLWASSDSNFIARYDESPALTNQLFIESDDDIWAGFYNIKIIGKVDPAVQGVETHEIEVELEIYSICNNATFS